jgi:ferric-dicitrate binding protein FerR (iron transport regulator)
MSGASRSLLMAAAAFASSLSAWAQSTVAARVIQMEGRVSIMQDNAEIPLYLGSSVEPKQLVRTGPDGYAKFQLADGSSFEVFQNSQVVFRTNPFNLGDLLDVVIGRVKVFIQHRNGPNPNRVTTQTAVISVRGTVFDVVVEDDDATTLVSVDEGVVGVRHLLLPGNEVQLTSGESLRVFRNQPLAKAVDKGGAAQKALRIAAQAIYNVMLMHPPSGGGPAGIPTGGGAGGTQSGDRNGKPPAGPAPPAPSEGSKPSSGSGGPPPPPPANH